MRMKMFYRIVKEIAPGKVVHCANVKKERFSTARGKKYNTLKSVVNHINYLQNRGHENLFVDMIPEKIYRSEKAYTYKNWYYKTTARRKFRRNIEMMSKYALPAPTAQVQKSAQQIEIENALRQNKTKAAAARSLGIHPDTLRNRMKKLNM